MSDKTVTIFVTVYNIEEHLERFFDCLKKQTYADYKVLMIDDGSADNSLAICERHALEDDRIRVISVEHIGISAARNLAFENLDTPYAASLDGDDYFDKDYLKHLMDAEEEYGADLVISNVIYVYENGVEKSRFPERSRGYYEKKDFSGLLPALLDESRLNFLYAKLYKTELLRDVRVEPDVMQGSDTMINCMYLQKTRSIAVIEDYDYCYVQYKKRSVTSYSGREAFNRLCRINSFVEKSMEDAGYMTDEMRRVIDGRFFFSGTSYLSRVGLSDTPLKEQYRIASEVVNSEEYLAAYRRQSEAGNIQGYSFLVPIPGKERDYVDHVRTIKKENEKNERLKSLREKCPEPVFRLWHGAKSRLGIARKK